MHKDWDNLLHSSTEIPQLKTPDTDLLNRVQREEVFSRLTANPTSKRITNLKKKWAEVEADLLDFQIQ